MELNVTAIAGILLAITVCRAPVQAQPPVAEDQAPSATGLSETLDVSALPGNYGEFSLFSEKQLLSEIASQVPTIRIPQLYDDFNRPNATTLGGQWRTTMMQPGSSIGIRRQEAVASGNIAAIMDDQLPNPNVRLKVRITSCDPESEAGVVFRGTESAGLQGPLDYQFVRVRSDGIVVGAIQGGTEIHEPVIAVSVSFPLTLSVVADAAEVYVYIDSREVAVIHNKPLAGRLAGLWATGHVTLDDFEAAGFHRNILPRGYYDNVRFTPSPFVTYQPIYGEHVLIERYGQHFGNCVQPVIEQLKFGADTALLPIRALRFPPWYCDSNVCYYPPGVPVLPLRFSLTH